MSGLTGFFLGLAVGVLTTFMMLALVAMARKGDSDD